MIDNFVIKSITSSRKRKEIKGWIHQLDKNVLDIIIVITQNMPWRSWYWLAKNLIIYYCNRLLLGSFSYDDYTIFLQDK